MKLCCPCSMQKTKFPRNLYFTYILNAANTVWSVLETLLPVQPVSKLHFTQITGTSPMLPTRCGVCLKQWRRVTKSLGRSGSSWTRRTVSACAFFVLLLACGGWGKGMQRAVSACAFFIFLPTGEDQSQTNQPKSMKAPPCKSKSNAFYVCWLVRVGH